MAGVSLALRRTLGSLSYVGRTGGYIYAGLSMAGPSLMTALCMYALHAGGLLGVAEWRVFQNLILYGYCGSIVLTGLFQLGVARYVSDRLYVGEVSSIVPAYVAATLLSLVVHSAVAGLFIAWTRPPSLVAAAEVAFFGSLALVWTGMIFLGAIRSFLFIIFAFLAGTTVSLVCAIHLGSQFQLAGCLAGFAAGQAATAALLAARLRAEFPAQQPFDFGFLWTMRAHPALCLIGVVYGLALWIDKIVFWVGPHALQAGRGLRSFPLYDNAAFLAYLTVVPTLALIFIRIEVSFYEKCTGFFRAIREGADLPRLKACRRALQESFDESLRRVVHLQAVITMACILLVPPLLEWIGLDWIQFYIFRVLSVGTFLHVVVFAMLLSALHLALYRQALAMVGLYLVVCAGVTMLGANLDASFYGYGPVAGGVAALLLGYARIRDHIRRIDYRTFMA